MWRDFLFLAAQKDGFSELCHGRPREAVDSEIAAGKVGRRIGLYPGNVVQKFEAELLHGEADGVDNVGGAGNPDGAVGFEYALAGGEPGEVEFMVGIGTFGFVPVALMNRDRS